MALILSEVGGKELNECLGCFIGCLSGTEREFE
jgi:hypothetical protein